MAPPQQPEKGKERNKNNNNKNTNNGDEPQDMRTNEGAAQQDATKVCVGVTINSVKDPRTDGTSYKQSAPDEVLRASSPTPPGAEPIPPKARIQDLEIKFVETSLPFTKSEPAASVPSPRPDTEPSAAASLSASQEQPPLKHMDEPVARLSAQPSNPARSQKTESSVPKAEDQKITPSPVVNTAAANAAAPAHGERISWAELNAGAEGLLLNRFAATERRLKQFGKPEFLKKLNITPETLPNMYGGVTKITKEAVAEFDALQQTMFDFLEEAAGQAPSSVRAQPDAVMSAEHSERLPVDMKEAVKLCQELMAQVKSIAAKMAVVHDEVQTLVQQLKTGSNEILNNVVPAVAKHVEDSNTGERFMNEVRQELAKNRHAYQELLQAISGYHQSTRSQLSQVTQKLDECAQQNQQLSDRMDRLEKQQKLLDPLNSFEKRGMFAKNIYDEVLAAVEGILRGHTAEEETKEGQSFSPPPAQSSETQWPAEVGLRPSVRAALEQVSTADRQSLNNQPAAMRFLRESSEPTALGFLKEPQYLKVLLTDAELCLRSLSE